LSAELVAIGIQIALTVFTAFILINFYKKEKKEILDTLDITNLKTEFIEIVDSKFNLEELKNEFTEIVDERLQTAIDSIGEAFSGILTDPTVKKAFSIIGSQGGETRSKNIAVDEMAKDMLEGPQFAAVRMGAEALGLDIESYIEKHGAMKTIQAAKQLADFAGIDLMNLNIGSLARPGPAGSGNNIFLRR